MLNSDKKEIKFLALLIEDLPSAKCLYNTDGTFNYFKFYMQNAKRGRLGVNFYKQGELSKSIFSNVHQASLLLEATQFLALSN